VSGGGLSGDSIRSQLVLAMPKTFPRHAEAETSVASSPEELFAYLDRHSQLSAHMTKSSWMMGGGRMEITADAGGFQRVGSRLRLSGKAFGLSVSLDEEVTVHEPPRTKVWQTVGAPRLLIIGAYRMGLAIERAPAGSRLRVFIDYALPSTFVGRLLGPLLAGWYARWCVKSMARDAQSHFATRSR
jgi:polyketide cyclase/dehydrase/lipid transport protein